MLSKGQVDNLIQQNGIDPEVGNKREYFRLNLTHPLLADMTIIKYMGKDITLGKTEVLIGDLSLGGLSFFSNIKMAARPDMLIKVLNHLTIKLRQKTILSDCRFIAIDTKEYIKHKKKQ